MISVAAFALRLLYMATANQDTLDGLRGDGWYYHLAANLLADGEGYVTVAGDVQRPFAGFPPLWATFLGVFSWVGFDSWWSHRMAAVLVGTLTVAVVGIATRQLVGPKGGLLAAGVAAVYPGLWYYEWALLSETLLHLLIAVFLVVVYRFWARPSALAAVSLGFVLGLMALTRAEELMLAPLVVAPMILSARTGSLRRRFAWLLAAGATTLVILGPWSLYNTARFDQPILLSNGLGTAMLVSNCDEVYSGDLLGYYANPGCPDELRERPETDIRGNQAEQDLGKRAAALSYMADNPERLPVVVAARIGRSIGVYRPVQTMDLQVDWTVSPRWVGGLWLWSFWLLLAAAVGGCVRLRRRQIPIYPFVGFLVLVVAGSALTFGSIRYRAALEVPLVVLAGIGLGWLVDRLGGGPNPEPEGLCAGPPVHDGDVTELAPDDSDLGI